MAEEWVRNVTAVPDRCKDGATPPAEITVSIARGDVEKNAQGGFRPRWHLVDTSGKPLAPGMDFLVREKRTMRDDSNSVLDRRFKVQTQRGGVVTYDWHWPTARGHANLAWYSWTLLPVPRAPYRISPSTQARVGIN